MIHDKLTITMRIMKIKVRLVGDSAVLTIPKVFNIEKDAEFEAEQPQITRPSSHKLGRVISV
ncbi:hypothetical protein CEW82_06000 [Lactiplantibacillus pentosus]|jgi:hypothetical protein|nr:hypothetical protein CEW82_06000 [Lactiplantibacillus pentosus]